jgi:hypothetical protein
MFRNGRLDVYADRLESRYGYGIIQKLTLESHKIVKYSREDLDDIYQKYRSLNEQKDILK